MNQFFKPSDLELYHRTSLTRSAKQTANEFMPIGVGKPLIIRLHTVYVGEMKQGFLNKKDSVLVTSKIKDDTTYEIPAPCVHQVYHEVEDRNTLYPRAGVEGTELIYYSNALEGGVLNIDLEIKADKFKKDIITDVSNGFSQAAGLPIFAPYAPFMLVGQQLLKTAGNVIEKAIDRTPLLRYSFKILYDVGGTTDTTEGLKIGTDDKYQGEFKGYEITPNPDSPGNFYLTKNGQQYDGDAPYIIISLDGRSEERYKDFKATIASAALLKKFYDTEGSTPIGDIQNMLQVYNDFNYVKKYRKIAAKIEQETEPSKKSELSALMEAYRLNIMDQSLLAMLSAAETR